MLNFDDLKVDASHLKILDLFDLVIDLWNADYFGWISLKIFLFLDLFSPNLIY